MRQYTDITGEVYGDLTALSHHGSDADGNANWLFRCICGKEVFYIAKKVRKGDALSCGCRRARNCATPKTCKHCGKPSTRKNRHGNLSSVCHKCSNKQVYGFLLRNPKVLLVSSARARAKQQNLPCTITVRDFNIPEFCPVFGMRLEQGDRKFHDNSPSLDKIIPELGYVPGNANRFKNDASPEELRLIADWIERNRPKLEVAA